MGERRDRRRKGVGPDGSKPSPGRSIAQMRGGFEKGEARKIKKTGADPSEACGPGGDEGGTSGLSGMGLAH